VNKYSEFSLIVVGSGFTGMTVAWNVAERTGKKVLVIEKRSHIGGNSYSYSDSQTGIEIHKYGTHIFHTSNKRVIDFITNFAVFNDYKHVVKTIHNNNVYSFPINLLTLSQFFGGIYTPLEAEQLITKKAIYSADLQNFEIRALAEIGPELYNAFFRGYTLKQWQTDPKNLPPEVFGRIPIRYTYNDRYFNDRFEGQPILGYGKIFELLSQHPKIRVMTDTNFLSLDYNKKSSQIIFFTGAIDRYFGNTLGPLTWRTLDFSLERHELQDYQGTAVLNYADEIPAWTRIHEFKHLTPERKNIRGTVIAKEFSRLAQESDEPYYPVNTKLDRKRLQGYKNLATKEQNVIFGGRLGRYQYLDMHMAIASGLQISDEIITQFRVKN
jgi:UDP-galactopyranose mutase